MIVLSIISTALLAQEPISQVNWDPILNGIAKVETNSYLKDGTFYYVNQRRGRAGERGPYQMTRIAFDQIKQPGDSFSRLETDDYYARMMARRYLIWLYNNSARGNVALAIQYYNAGPNNSSYRYYRKVIASVYE